MRVYDLYDEADLDEYEDEYPEVAAYMKGYLKAEPEY